MTVGGTLRQGAGWEPWVITTRIDARAYARQVARAIGCHRSQLPSLPALNQLSDDQHRALWGVQELYRAFSLYGGGRAVEDDLFAGLREMTVEHAI